MALSVASKAVKSDVGRQRDHNEDSAIEVEPMFMLADGMGGAQAGEVASQTAAKVFSAGPGEDGTPELQVTRLGEIQVPRHCGERMQVVRRPAADG